MPAYEPPPPPAYPGAGLAGVPLPPVIGSLATADAAWRASPAPAPIGSRYTAPPAAVYQLPRAQPPPRPRASPISARPTRVLKVSDHSPCSEYGMSFKLLGLITSDCG